MNETSNPNQSQPNNGSQPHEPANPGPQPGRSPLDSLCSAVNEGAQQAKAAAEKAIPKVKAAVSDAAYWLGYGVSFATVFSYTVVRELAPEVLKAGCHDGAQAGHKAAEDLASQIKTPHAATDTTSAPGSEPSSPAAQPGMA